MINETSVDVARDCFRNFSGGRLLTQASSETQDAENETSFNMTPFFS